MDNHGGRGLLLSILLMLLTPPAAATGCAAPPPGCCCAPCWTGVLQNIRLRCSNAVAMLCVPRMSHTLAWCSTHPSSAVQQQWHTAHVTPSRHHAPSSLQNVVLYAGSGRDRDIIAEHEFWYSGARGPTRFNVLLASYETVLSDR